MQKLVQSEMVGLGFTYEHPYSSGYRVTKRLVDLVGSILALICLLPVMGICAVLVRLSSPGPVLFRQQRVGEAGRTFSLIKFRSMRADSDPELHRQYVTSFIAGQAEQHGEGGPQLYKLVHDPRTTSIGRWLRRTSLDELPQLWNVVRGEMSLVGPRPPIPYELDHYRAWHFERLAVKPGITGLWQVSGRSRTTFEEMVHLDLQYIRTASLVTDLRILARTVPTILAQRAA